MIVYSSENFIKAHQDVTCSYTNHSFDRYVREVICGNCGYHIGEQSMYPNFENKFEYVDKERNQWKFCPKCGKNL